MLSYPEPHMAMKLLWRIDFLGARAFHWTGRGSTTTVQALADDGGGLQSMQRRPIPRTIPWVESWAE